MIEFMYNDHADEPVWSVSQVQVSGTVHITHTVNKHVLMTVSGKQPCT